MDGYDVLNIIVYILGLGAGAYAIYHILVRGPRKYRKKRKRNKEGKRKKSKKSKKKNREYISNF